MGDGGWTVSSKVQVTKVKGGDGGGMELREERRTLLIQMSNDYRSLD
jgi:hypothetical protein